MTYTTPVTELYRLFESDKLTQVITGADVGRTLDSVLSTYYGTSGLTDLVPTFVDDFDNVAGSMGDNTGGKTWMCPVEIGLAGLSIAQPFTSGNYTQVDATTLGMVCRREAGLFKKGCNAATAFYGAHVNATPIINWCQQFGYLEAKFKPADPTGSNAVTYPAFWFRSINFFGGTGTDTGDVFRTNIEDDLIEHYNADPLVYSQPDRALHTTLHHHEPQKLIGPGQWGRDTPSNTIIDTRTYPGFGNPVDFEMYNDYHTYSELIAPDFRWYFYDRKLYGKMVNVPEMQDRFAMYISHSIATETSPGWTSGVDYTMLVDYVKCWQHPDWQTTPLGASVTAAALGGNQLNSTALTGAGTANAKTLTSVLAMTPAYVNLRTFVAKFATANTAACTLNVNGIGAKNIYKYPNVNVFPPNGTPIALTGGEIGVNEWKFFIYMTSLNGGAGGFLLWNPNYSMERPARWAPAALLKSNKLIDVQAVEAGLVEKHGIDRTLFPVNHPARIPAGIPVFTPPQMDIGERLIIVTGLTAGAHVGSAAVKNVPTDQIRYHQVGGTAHFTTDPATGEITVASGYTTAIGVEEFLVYAWPVIPRPLVRGSNVKRVIVDTRTDADFDLSYFSGTTMWLDAQLTSSLSLDGSNNVLGWNDRSPSGLIWKDDDTLTTDIPPVYNATALNSLPAVVSTTPALKMLTSYLGGAKVAPVLYGSAVTTRASGSPLTNRVSISFNGIGRLTNTFDITVPCMGLFVWTKTPSNVTFWGNGSLIGMDPAALQTGITADGWSAFVIDCLTTGGGGLGQLFNAGKLFEDTTFARQFDGALGEVASGSDLLNQTLIDKIFGYLAAHWNLQTLLPAAHPYKSTAPKMWR